MLNEETIYLLQQIYDTMKRIEGNVSTISCPDDFLTSPEGMLRLESTCMLLIAIGESLKAIDKLTNKQLLALYPEVDWKGAKGLRDIIAHHYFEIDADIVFDVATEKIPPMRSVIERIMKDNGIV